MASALSEAGGVVAQADERKCVKYRDLATSHIFVPVAIETSGAFGPRTGEFLTEFGQRLWQVTGEVRSRAYSLQRLSVAIQKGNAASVLGTISHGAELEDKTKAYSLVNRKGEEYILLLQCTNFCHYFYYKAD